MKKLFTSCSLVVLLLLVSVNAIADIARPKPTPEKPGKVVLHAALEIAVDPKDSEARLQITESDLKALVASVNGAGANQNVAASVTSSPTRTIVAGVLLCLSLSFAGVWIARSRRVQVKFGRREKAVVIGLLCVSALGATAIITRGNAGPPPYYRWRSLPENLTKGQSTYGGVNVEIVPDSTDGNTRMKLIIPLRK